MVRMYVTRNRQGRSLRPDLAADAKHWQEMGAVSHRASAMYLAMAKDEKVLHWRIGFMRQAVEHQLDAARWYRRARGIMTRTYTLTGKRGWWIKDE